MGRADSEDESDSGFNGIFELEYHTDDTIQVYRLLKSGTLYTKRTLSKNVPGKYWELKDDTTVIYRSGLQI